MVQALQFAHRRGIPVLGDFLFGGMDATARCAMRHPHELGAGKVQQFLSMLTTQRNVSAALALGFRR